MDVTDVAAIAATAKDLFRLEAQPTYLVEQEAEDLAAWRRGDRTLLTPETSTWLAHIRDTTAAGARWSRVRILDYPLTDYAEFELHGYQANQRAGEQIYVADRAWSRELSNLHDDFWIFDETVVRMIYDRDGHFLRPELAVDKARFDVMRSIGLRYSISLTDFLADREPRLIA
ncbi:hypothetical protein DMC63_37945 [Streptomyces sp. WAC 05977]|nr:hypothetical protein DMC63_37945 [Streptomyces sp. WAC 05977]